MSGWAIAAAVAVAAGIGAVALAQGGSLGPPAEPMSEQDVLKALAEVESTAESTPESAAESQAPGEASERPSAAGPSEAAPSAASTGEQVFGGEGGTFLVVCEGGSARIEWWAPAQGWHVSDVDAGPDDDVEIEFEKDTDDTEIEYSVVCRGGTPQLEEDD